MPDPERKYARVYYSVIDDPKFAGIYTDDHHLSTWLRLLLLADAMWPASPPLPRTIRATSLKALVEARIVDLMPSDCFRVHGLDPERNARASRASNAAAVRWQSDSNADALPRARGDETSIDETRLDEPNARKADDPPMTKAIDYLEDRTGREWHGRPGHVVWDTLDADLKEVGLDRLLAVYRTTEGTDFGQIILGASRTLHPITGRKNGEDPDRPVSVARAETTRRELDAEDERRTRISAGPMKPLRELMPDVKLGKPS